VVEHGRGTGGVVDRRRLGGDGGPAVDSGMVSGAGRAISVGGG
jgi:hypothetical protein